MSSDSGAKVFLFDVSHQAEDIEETLQQLQNGCNNNPTTTTIIQITGRLPKIGGFAHFQPELQLKEDSRIIITADRRISMRGTRIAVYANCQEFLTTVQPGSVIRIGATVRLSVMEVVRDCFVCTVNTMGPIKPGDTVNFPVCVDEDVVTTEEKQDISIAINCKASALLLPAATSEKYLQSIRNHLQHIDNGHVKLFVSSSSTCVPTMRKAYSIASTYDGIFYTFCNRYCANVRENIEPTVAEQYLLKECHKMRKPIIIRPNCTENEQIAMPDLAGPAFVKYLQYYPDGFLVPANLRQSFANVLSGDYNEDAKVTSLLELNRHLGSSTSELPVFERLCMNASIASYHLETKAIFVISDTGRTAIELSNYRPVCPIVVITSNEYVAAKLLMYKSCKVVMYKKQTDEIYSNNCERARMLLCGLDYALHRKIAALNDPIVLVYRSVPIVTYCDIFMTMRVSDFKYLWCSDVNDL